MEYQAIGREEKTSAAPARILAGLVLLVIGIGLAGWIVLNIIHAMKQGMNYDFIADLMPKEAARTLVIEGQKVTIPEALFRFAAYSTTAFLLFVMAMIATAFLSGGVKLFTGGDSADNAAMRLQLEHINKTLVQIRDRGAPPLG
ncbi:hypothetical protein JW905_00675 [bacterium]|nr:hypothetical protein [candidate division CSSED10-310 bacterium]